VAAGAIGQGLEIYDFAIYGFMAVTIAGLFFPQGNPTAALFSTFAIFSVGFIARPIGGLFLGNLGDKIGRRNALAVVVIGMAVATCAIGLLPTYGQIGILASILLFICRFAQGFIAGGDYGNSSAFLVEYAPDDRRGFYGSWQQFAVVAGALLASAVATALTNSVSEEALNSWAWRVPFILALIPGLFGP
jgi:MHS family proline/betaine transporter-like MFS transporter